MNTLKVRESFLGQAAAIGQTRNTRCFLLIEIVSKVN